MVTSNDRPTFVEENKFIYSFVGLSTDTKPEETYESNQIANGSTFLELDTKNVYMYDESTNAWL